MDTNVKGTSVERSNSEIRTHKPPSPSVDTPEHTQSQPRPCLAEPGSPHSFSSLSLSPSVSRLDAPHGSSTAPPLSPSSAPRLAGDHLSASPTLS